MRLRGIGHDGFRNLTPATTELARGTTVLVGDNGQGKTSLLEAIGVLATTKSFRRARPAEMLQHGASSFFVRGSVGDEDRNVRLALAHADGRREATVDRQPVELADYIRHLTVIPVTSVQAGIVRGGPQDRRDFLDRGVLGISPGYLRSLSAYRRTLRHVNALLRRGASATELATWNDRLADVGAELVVRRRQYVARLERALEDVGDELLPEAERLSLDLRDVVSREDPDIDAEELTTARVRELLAERLSETSERAAAMGQAVVGPHRDELVLTAGGRDVRRFASSGQQRNALLALKVAKVEVFRRERSESPVLLVDDVDTEVDVNRLQRFLDHVGGRAQAVLTSSKLGLFSRVPNDALFLRVESGVIAPS